MSKQNPPVSITGMDAETPNPTEMKTGVEIVDATQAVPSPAIAASASMEASIVFGPPVPANEEDVSISIRADPQAAGTQSGPYPNLEDENGFTKKYVSENFKE